MASVSCGNNMCAWGMIIIRLFMVSFACVMAGIISIELKSFPSISLIQSCLYQIIIHNVKHTLDIRTHGLGCINLHHRTLASAAASIFILYSKCPSSSNRLRASFIKLGNIAWVTLSWITSWRNCVSMEGAAISMCATRTVTLYVEMSPLLASELAWAMAESGLIVQWNASDRCLPFVLTRDQLAVCLVWVV